MPSRFHRNGAAPAVALVFVAVAACTGSVASPSAAAPTGSRAPTSDEPGASARRPVDPIALPHGCSEARPCDLDAGTYVLTGEHAFMPGLTVTVPVPWTSAEQDRGEFRVERPGEPGELFFWKDVTPVGHDGTPLDGVDRTSAGFVDWLQNNPDFVTSEPKAVTIGSEIPATTILVGVAETAQNADPDCPVAVCLGVLTDTQHWGPGGIGYAIGRMDEPLYLRLYFADIVAGSVPHTLVVALDPSLEAGGATGLAGLEAFAAPILGSVRLPPDAAPADEVSSRPSNSGPVELHSGCGDIAPCRLSAGTYETAGEWPFLRGLQFTVPDGWSSPFHAAGELWLLPPGWDDYGIFLARDPVPVAGHRGLSTDTDGTAAGLAEWIARHPDLTVHGPDKTTIGNGIEATTVTVTVSADAETDDPDCPARACVDFVRSWEHEFPLGMAEGQVARLYFADIGTVTSPHMLSVNVWAPSERDLARLIEIARPILDSLAIPDPLSL